MNRGTAKCGERGEPLYIVHSEVPIEVFWRFFYALSCFARYPSFSLHPTQRFRAVSRTNADATSRNVVACATDCSSPLRVFSLFLLFCRTITLRRYAIRGESIEVIRIAYSTMDASRTLKQENYMDRKGSGDGKESKQSQKDEGLQINHPDRGYPAELNQCPYCISGGRAYKDIVRGQYCMSFAASMLNSTAWPATYLAIREASALDLICY